MATSTLGTGFISLLWASSWDGGVTVLAAGDPTEPLVTDILLEARKHTIYITSVHNTGWPRKNATTLIVNF